MGSEGTGPAPNTGETASASGSSGAGGGGGSGPTGGAGGGGGSEGIGPLPLANNPTARWALTGIIGTGQSLGVGAQNAAATPAATMPSYNNLKLALNGVAVPPFTADTETALSLVPLTEPIRPTGSGYPRAYPGNLFGESPHHAMSAQITALAHADGLPDYVTVHSVVGEAGQGMTIINKAAVDMTTATTSMGRAYAASLFETRAIARIAREQNLGTFGVGAIILTHGETDAGTASYEDDMLKLWTDYNADLKAITGQTEPIPLFTQQQQGIGYTAGQRTPIALSTTLQWRAALDHPAEIVCVGPKYQYPYGPDALHLVSHGYELMGEKHGEAYYQHVVLGRAWKPLQPAANTVTRTGAVITIDFEVPVPPLAWDEVLPPPHQGALLGEWAQGKGFEVRMGQTPIAITTVELVDADTVRITCAADVPAGATLGYAATSDGTVPAERAPRWGLLKDSDPFVGDITKEAQANYAVSFEVSLP